jgi:glycosyltransferase involved in cell wall biosynthesis
VIQCADYGSPYRGSFVPMLVAAAEEAARRGHRTTVVFSESARGRPWLTDLDGIAAVRFVRPQGSRLAGIRPMLRQLASMLEADDGPAVIHTHFDTFDIPAALMRFRRKGVTVFWHEHSAFMDDPRTRLRNTLRFACVGQLVEGMLCISPELRDDVRARHAPARKLIVFPNAIDTRTFSPITPAERGAARGSLALPDQARVVLHFGWSWERKGGDLMLGAAEILASEPDLVFLTVLGEDDVPSSALDANPIVRPLPPTNDVRSLYAAADVFLSCSRAEGALPLAALEALACGLPLVATDIPVQGPLLAGLPGAAAVEAEPRSIATGIGEMLALSDGERIEHASRSRDALASSFALDAWARRLVDLYEAGRGSAEPGPSLGRE